jgi:hypothetical protein
MWRGRRRVRGFTDSVAIALRDWTSQRISDRDSLDPRPHPITSTIREPGTGLADDAGRVDHAFVTSDQLCARRQLVHRRHHSCVALVAAGGPGCRGLCGGSAARTKPAAGGLER